MEEGRDASSGASLATATRLMRLALPLLDKAGHEMAAVHLQRALDEVDGVEIGPSTAEEVARLLDR